MLRDKAARVIQIRRWLEERLVAQDLAVWYQPIVSIGSGAVMGYEALSRGRREGEPVPASEFVAIAEEFGLVDRITDHVLGVALTDLPRLPGSSPYVAVNLSPLELRDPGVVQRVADHLARAGVPGGRLVLEITEGAVVDNDPSVLARLDQLRSLGVGLAIDDFGMGYSSLSSLAQLPLQTVKLDRSLIEHLGADPNAAVIVERTIQLAHDLGLRVVVEGVEAETQLDSVSEAGADAYQGWLFGRAQPIGSILDASAGRSGKQQR